MGFILNNGDIVLDVVLTKEGRRLLAKGDGSFKITKWAPIDTEVNYQLYDNTHSSGSAYYDLQILQTPIMEANTYGDAEQSKLLTINRTNLLYLPVMKLNEVYASSTKRHTSGPFIVAVDKATEDAIMTDGTNTVNGVIPGENVGAGAYIKIDQGIDNTAISPAFSLDSDLVETQYVVELDNRFGSVISTGTTKATPSYIDSDNVASYYFSLGSDVEFVSENTDRTTATTQTIAGPRGTSLEFTLQSSLDLNSSTYLFTLLGTTGTMTGATGTVSIRYIDTTVRVRGSSVGSILDIPVRFVKKQ